MLFRYGTIMKNPLTKLQIDVLELFFQEPFAKMYFLTGGTALAGFYLYHRKSEDLDLFTLENINILSLENTFDTTAKKTLI